MALSFLDSTLGGVDTLEFWVENWWLPLGLLIVGASFSKAVRERVWAPLGRGLRWLTTIRLTTTRKMREAEETAGESIRDQQRQYDALRERARKEADTASIRIAALQDQLELAKASAAEARAAQVEQHAKVNEYAREMGRTEGRAEAMREVKAQRAALTVRPVWRVREMKNHRESDAFTLSNVQPDAGPLSEVWIESRLNGFLFNSRNQWPGPWHEPVVFRGERPAASSTPPSRCTTGTRTMTGRSARQCSPRRPRYTSAPELRGSRRTTRLGRCLSSEHRLKSRLRFAHRLAGSRTG